MTQNKPAFLIFLLITLVKIGLLICFVSSGRLEPFVGDNAKDHYLPIADRLIAEGKFNDPQTKADSKVPIGYPALLAAMKLIAPHHQVLLTVCLQMVMDMVVALLLYSLALQIGSSGTVGIWAGTIWLLFPPAIMISCWITAETVFNALLTMSIALLIMGLKKNGGAPSYLAAGSILGVGTLFRATCLWVPAFLLPLWLSRPVERSLYKGCMFAVGLMLVVLPWTVRNILVLDDAIIVSVGSGSVFMQGSDERVFTIEGKHQHYPAMYAAAIEAGYKRPTSGKESAADNWMFKVGLYNYQQRLQTRPWSFVPFAFHKLARLWYGTESGGWVQQTALAVLSGLFVPVGLWQIWRWRARQPSIAILFGLLVTYFILLHFVTLPQYRYMLPIYPLLILSTCAFLAGRHLTKPSASTNFAEDVPTPVEV